MSVLEFTPFPKLPRLNRDITISEKLDGTNAAVVIVTLGELDHIKTERASIRLFDDDARNLVATAAGPVQGGYLVFAQSRTRFITPERDNYGFARWVQNNAQALVDTLGAGTHFGEWWGSGIQRKYGLTGGDKRFSLFNTARWGKEAVWIGDSDTPAMGGVPGLGVVPVLYEGIFDQIEIDRALRRLGVYGSAAAPGFMRPEGIVVWHTAARHGFKATLEGDEAPKGIAAHALDEEKLAA
ncbi:RNA ligase family protein [Microbacterium sp. zg-YB36]|uniref:RNA ligase family protein n=1 Tax=Microbacterium sp. zg-YB36 TaxID=2969407 RepID=UPI00214BDD53|nr:RNA ligase family protein [Microbacterium sp. zg-YB36]MDL5351183.1 RNA ligase family protein [Microbacterium sp. zg-YB36]